MFKIKIIYNKYLVNLKNQKLYNQHFKFSVKKSNGQFYLFLTLKLLNYQNKNII